MSCETFGFRLLIANILVVQRTLRQNNLDARGCSDLRIIIVLWRALLNNEERVELVDVAHSISSDQSDEHSLLDTDVERLKSDSATSIEPVHHERDKLADWRILCDSDSSIQIFRNIAFLLLVILSLFRWRGWGFNFGFVVASLCLYRRRLGGFSSLSLSLVLLVVINFYHR